MYGGLWIASNTLLWANQYYRMEKQVQDMVQRANTTLALAIQSESITSKRQLLQSLYPLIQSIDQQYNSLAPSYKKKALEHQINTLKAEIKEQSEKTQRDGLMAQRITYIAQSINGAKNPEGMERVVYNPRETAAQNLFQSIMWKDINESKLMLRNSELNLVAKKMEDHKHLQQEIAQIVHQQEQEIDIITSNIKKAHENVKHAEIDILFANMYDGGDEVELDINGNVASINGKPPPNYIPPQPPTVLPGKYQGLMKARDTIRNALRSLGSSIKGMFRNIFGRNNHRQAAE